MSHLSRFLIKFTGHLGQLLLLVFLHFLHPPVDLVLPVIQLSVFVFEIYETAAQLLNPIAWVRVIVLVFVLVHDAGQEVGVLLGVLQLALPPFQLCFLVFNTGSQLLNSCRVVHGILLKLLQLLIFLLPLCLVVDDLLFIRCD